MLQQQAWSFLGSSYLSHMFHVWYIYLENWMIFRVNVGKYSRHGAYGYEITIWLRDEHPLTSSYSSYDVGFWLMSMFFLQFWNAAIKWFCEIEVSLEKLDLFFLVVVVVMVVLCPVMEFCSMGVCTLLCWKYLNTFNMLMFVWHQYDE